ncbi:MAG: PASTA domain-containing protein [Planctomycetota bacterium]
MMKKITIVLAVLMLAAPAMAVVTLTATESGLGEIDITAETSGEGTLPRAFALDIVVDSGQIITGISNYFVGECTSSGRGYGIFPASFNRTIDADDPCWGEPNYTPVADVNDLPGDTQGGLGTPGITIEMGSLYKGANSPPNPVTLCTISVSGSSCISLALNVGRGKIIMEDGNEPASVVLGGGTSCVVVCTVPDVWVQYEGPACVAIIAAGFVCSSTYEFHDTVPLGKVIRQNPPPGTIAPCGSTIEITVSLGPCIVPSVMGMTEAAATTAITGAGFTVAVNYVAGTPLDEVVAQSPAGGATPGCGTAVNIDVAGDCMKDTHPAYARWVAKGKPDCWCYAKNCYGDIDGVTFGPFHVSATDKHYFVLALNQIVLPPNGICADLDRSDFGPFAVSTADKDIFTTYLNQIVVPDCDDTHINYWTN